jgi:hypothetical protein
MSSKYYYGWRDLGFGPIRKPEITAVIGNFTSNDYVVKSPDEIEKEYCSNCQCKLVFSAKINKWICPNHGCNLTKEESDIILGKDPPSSSSLPPSLPTTTTTTAFEEQANSLLDDLEPGVGGGFIPMQRAGNTDVISRQEGKAVGGNTGGGYTMTIPSRKKKGEGGYYTTPSGKLISIDSDRQKLIDSGYTITDADDKIPSSSDGEGGTYNSESELNKQRQIRLREPFKVGPVDDADNNKNGLQV